MEETQENHYEQTKRLPRYLIICSVQHLNIIAPSQLLSQLNRTAIKVALNTKSKKAFIHTDNKEALEKKLHELQITNWKYQTNAKPQDYVIKTSNTKETETLKEVLGEPIKNFQNKNGKDILIYSNNSPKIEEQLNTIKLNHKVEQYKPKNKNKIIKISKLKETESIIKTKIKKLKNKQYSIQNTLQKYEKHINPQMNIKSESLVSEQAITINPPITNTKDKNVTPIKTRTPKKSTPAKNTPKTPAKKRNSIPQNSPSQNTSPDLQSVTKKQKPLDIDIQESPNYE